MSELHAEWLPEVSILDRQYKGNVIVTTAIIGGEMAQFEVPVETVRDMEKRLET